MNEPNATKVNLLNFTRQEMEDFFLRLGEKSFRATQLFKWIHQLGVIDFNQMTNFSLSLRENLIANTAIVSPQVVKERVATDGTRKWLLQLEDKNFIEMVFIPEKARGTLCVSTQVGCPLNCSFCATGKQGFTRNLTVAEIIGQLWLVVRQLSSDQTSRTHVVTNVVFMGMGEPLLNLDNVVKAAQIMLDDNGYSISKYRVTVSTAGLIPELEKLRTMSAVALAISLHAPNDELRNQLMPINKKYPLRELIKVCDHYFDDHRRQVTIEYIMLAGINDSIECAKQLVKLLSHGRYKVNLIPASGILGEQLHASPMEKIDRFRDVLLSAGINTITRKSRGADIEAACGQLVAARS
jgi:23S rRNA (adenine2503-C2)-methyltransferase